VLTQRLLAQDDEEPSPLRAREGRTSVAANSKKPKASLATFSVYVIRLDGAVAEVRRFKEANPDRRLDKPCVYVGMTARKPEERFEQHRRGFKASRLVKRFGLSLIPRLYLRWNPMTYEQAKKKEVELARRLRKRGYGVWQN